MKKYYFDVHVQILPKHGYSIGVVMESSIKPNEDDVIAYASDKGLFEEFEDRDYVDYVDELEKEDFKNAFNREFHQQNG